jgi:hypothetical protein
MRNLQSSAPANRYTDVRSLDVIEGYPTGRGGSPPTRSA